jgi:hypothetical protein
MLFEMSVLPDKYCEKLDADDIEIITQFIDKGIDINIFDITKCKTFECFELLIACGYKIRGIDKIVKTIEYWELEKKIDVIKCIMADDKTRSRLDLDNNIFNMILSIKNYSDSNAKAMCEMIVTYFPEIKVNAVTLLKFWYCGEILEPLFDFTSEELIIAWLSDYIVRPIEFIAKYCDPAHYLTVEVFRRVFISEDKISMKYLLDAGYNLTSDSFPDRVCIKSFKYLKKLNLWNGETFDWEKHQYKSYYIGLSGSQWLRENHCPEHIIEKIAN